MACSRKIPVGLPDASRSIRPPSGFGVDAATGAARTAAESARVSATHVFGAAAAGVQEVRVHVDDRVVLFGHGAGVTVSAATVRMSWARSVRSRSPLPVVWLTASSRAAATAAAGNAFEVPGVSGLFHAAVLCAAVAKLSVSVVSPRKHSLVSCSLIKTM